MNVNITTEHSVATRALSIAALLAFMIAAPRAEAFFYWQCGGDPTIWSGDPRMRINNFNIPAGSGDDNDARNAMTRWNRTPGTSFDFRIGTTNTGRTSTSDGQNRIEYQFQAEVAFAHAHQRYDTCITWWPGQNQDIEESDVHIFADWLVGVGANWQNNAPDPRVRDLMHLRHIFVHELGHSLGLSQTNPTHENRFLDNMNAADPGGGSTGGSSDLRNITLPDAARGARFLYPGSATVRDLFVTNYRLRAGTTSAVLVPSLPACMRPGQRFTIFFTIGNRGNLAAPSSNCGVYMSTNDFISASDTRIAGCTWGPPANALVEMDSITTTVPAGTPTGVTRFFGLFLDDSDTVSESIESNNKVAAPGSPNSTDGVRIQATCP